MQAERELILHSVGCTGEEEGACVPFADHECAVCLSTIRTTDLHDAKVPVLYNFHLIEIMRWFQKEDVKQPKVFSLQTYFPEKLSF